MPKPAENVLELIGKTPLLKLARFAPEAEGHIFGKLENRNPGASVKDRIALAMVEAAEKEGLLKPGGTIIEPTSGNTGIGLALVSSVKGYRLIITMPESMSIERRRLLKALGAELILTPAEEGMKGAVAMAEKLLMDIDGGFMPQQFQNPANPDIHFRTTGQEIWDDLDGSVDVFVAGVGTAGTMAGAGKFLKEKNPNIHTVAVEPAESPVLSGGQPGPHVIQGIGAGFVPGNYDGDVVDEVLPVRGDDALKTSRKLARTEGVLCGISAGANVFAASQLAQRDEFKGKNIVTIICDTGERYLSTMLFPQD